jgi:hypothetical protein
MPLDLNTYSHRTEGELTSAQQEDGDKLWKAEEDDDVKCLHDNKHEV